MSFIILAVWLEGGFWDLSCTETGVGGWAEEPGRAGQSLVLLVGVGTFEVWPLIVDILNSKRGAWDCSLDSFGLYVVTFSF